MNSENTRFLNTWYCNYIKQGKKGNQGMVNDLDIIKVADFNNYRKDSVEGYQKGVETELRIIQLERKADSLKASTSQSK